MIHSQLREGPLERSLTRRSLLPTWPSECLLTPPGACSHWLRQVWTGSCPWHACSADRNVRPCHGRAWGGDWSPCHCTEGVEDEEGECRGFLKSDLFNDWLRSSADPDHHPEVHAGRLFRGLEYPGPDYLRHVDRCYFSCMQLICAAAAPFFDLVQAWETIWFQRSVNWQHLWERLGCSSLETMGSGEHQLYGNIAQVSCESFSE